MIKSNESTRFVAGKSKEREDIPSTHHHDSELDELYHGEKQEGRDELYKIPSKPTVNKTF